MNSYDRPDWHTGGPDSYFPGGPPPSRTPRHWATVVTVLIVLGAMAIVLVPVALVLLPKETARWHEAAAVEKQLDGDLKGAIDSLDRAIQLAPERTDLRLMRAQYKLARKDLRGALNELNGLIKQEPDLQEAYMLRGEVYQYLGRYADAVQDWKQIRKLDKEQMGEVSAQVLNGLAYARALAKQELEEGLQDVDQALKETGTNAAMLDTRGFLYHQLGQPRQAQEDLDQAVELAERMLQELQDLDERQARAVDARELAQLQEAYRKTVAVIRYHRALVYQQLERRKAAQRDLQRVEELGYEAGDELF